MLNPRMVGMRRPLKHHDDLTPPAILCDVRVATDDVAGAPDCPNVVDGQSPTYNTSTYDMYIFTPHFKKVMWPRTLVIFAQSMTTNLVVQE